MRACRLPSLGGQATHSDFGRKAADERLLAVVALHARLLLVELDGLVAKDVDKPAGARGERGGHGAGGWSRARYSMTRSNSLREARRAGLNTTISAFCVRRKQAQKMAIEKVLPKRRGVLRSQDPVLVGGRAGTNTRQGSAPDQHLARARLPAVLLHDAGLLHAPVFAVHDARRRLEEVFVELWPTRGGVGKQWGTGTVRSKTEAKVPS